MKLRTVAGTGLLVATLASALGACASPAASAVPSTGSPASGSTGSAASAPASGARPETVRDFQFDTPDLAVNAGADVVVTNAGPTIHNLTIRDSSGVVLGRTADLKPGASETIMVDVPVGSYTIFCSLPGHESLGIKGSLSVSK